MTDLNLKVSKIDLSTASKQDILAEIARLDKLQNYYQNVETSLKKFISSSYGVIGHSSFLLYDTDVAEAITQQGKDMILFVAGAVNKYFKNKWKEDKRLHKTLNINVSSNVNKDVVCYIATDAIYIEFEHILKTTNYDGDVTTFIQNLYEHRLKSYFKKVFDIYCEKYNVENQQFLKMEKIAQSGIWLAKGRYILDIVWENGDSDGLRHKSLSNVLYKGVEIIQKSTPSFIRKKMKEVIEYIIEKNSSLDINELTKMLKKIKNEVKLQDIENLSSSIKISDYDKNVKEDRIALRLNENCPIHVRAAAIYNYKISNSKFKQRYPLIKSGDRIKYYYVKSKTQDSNVFAFIEGFFPIELAPDIDVDLTFNKTILEPTNKILKIIGMHEINNNLITIQKWF